VQIIRAVSRLNDMRRFPYQPKKDKKEQKANILAAPPSVYEAVWKGLALSQNAWAQRASAATTPPANELHITQGSGLPSKII